MTEPVDYDGIQLVRRNFSSEDDQKYKAGSKVMTQHIQHLTERKKQPADAVERYVVIDFETTGLDMEEDKIIEFGAVRVVGGQVEETFSTLEFVLSADKWKKHFPHWFAAKSLFLRT